MDSAIAYILDNVEQFGAFGPIMFLIGTAALAVWSLHKLFFGTFLFRSRLKNANTIRGITLLFCVVGLIALAGMENGSGPAEVDLRIVSLGLLGLGVVGGLVFLLFAQPNIIDPSQPWPEGPVQIVVGTKYTEAAEAHRKRNPTLTRAQILADFGNAPSAIPLVWTRGSLIRVWAIVILATLATTFGFVGALVAYAADLVDIRIERTQDNATSTTTLPLYRVFAKDQSSFADLKTGALEAELSRIVAFKPTRIEVHGHTDGDGSESYNEALSEKRANSVKAWLEAQEPLKGITVKAIGFGESVMISQEAGKIGKELRDAQRVNRRVSLMLFRE